MFFFLSIPRPPRRPAPRSTVVVRSEEFATTAVWFVEQAYAVWLGKRWKTTSANHTA